MMRNDIEYNSPANRSEVSERNENNEQDYLNIVSMDGNNEQ